MKEVKISGGKLQGFKRVTTREGKFIMMGVGARDTLRKMLAEVTGKKKEKITFKDMAICKKSIMKILSPFYSAVSTDPIYGYPSSIKYIPKDTGLILSVEETGYQAVGETKRERKSSFISGWNVNKVKRAGADAAKLIIYYRKEVKEEVREHQKKMARKIGEECERYDILYILEIMSYPLLEDEIRDRLNYAKRLPEIVIDYVKEFSKPEYNVDILKIDFPADLKYCTEFAKGEFDGKKRRAIYSLREIENLCKTIRDISSVPWIILSGGVGIKEFLIKVKLASDNGASGFLGGRPLWQEAIKFYPDAGKMEEWLITGGVDNFQKLLRASENATPWFSHKKFESFASIELKDGGENWHKNYQN